jgi:hypothetical protein
MCLRVGDPDGVQEGHKRFIMVRAEECPTSSGGGETLLSCTKVLAVGVTSGRERGMFPDLKMKVKVRVQLCRSPRKIQKSCVFVCACVLFSLERSLHASFYSLKEVQAYKILVRGVILVRERERAPRPQEGLIWWGHDSYYRGMESVLLVSWLHGRSCAPLLKEWSLSLGATTTCLDVAS